MNKRVGILSIFMALVYMLLSCWVLYINLAGEISLACSTNPGAALFSSPGILSISRIGSLLEELGYTPLSFGYLYFLRFFETVHLLLFVFGLLLCFLPLILTSAFEKEKKKQLQDLLDCLYKKKPFDNTSQVEMVQIAQYAASVQENAHQEQKNLILSYQQRLEESENLVHQLQIDLSNVVLNLDMLQEKQTQPKLETCIESLQHISAQMKMHLQKSKEISLLTYLSFSYLVLAE